MVENADSRSTEQHNVWPSMWEPFKQLGHRVAGFFNPAADAATSGESYQISVELPGVKPEDVQVELHDHLLTVKGEKHFEREESNKTYFFSERRYGSFHRAFRLPDNVSANDVDASFANGVLEIRVAKKTPSGTDAARIPVRTD